MPRAHVPPGDWSDQELEDAYGREGQHARPGLAMLHAEIGARKTDRALAPLTGAITALAEESKRSSEIVTELEATMVHLTRRIVILTWVVVLIAAATLVVGVVRL